MSNPTADTLNFQADRIERVLASHRVPVRVHGGSVAPRWVRFLLTPALGARVSAVRNLSEELALALGAGDVRVARDGESIAVEVPRDELGPVASNEMWGEIYDRVAELIRENRTTLVFVNTRRLSERVAHHLGMRLGENAVLPHHGSLSRALRLDAETRLKNGELKAVVATASLELGIDIGTVDLVCQIGSPRSIAVALQRVGRSGHWVGALPKGRIFATTRDELLECAALVRAIRSGELDRIEIPQNALDILAQQMVAACACEDFSEDELFALIGAEYEGCGKVLVDLVCRLFTDIAPDDFAGIGFRGPFEFKKLFVDFRIETVVLGIEHIKDQASSTLEMKGCSL
jgi:hypothetical protein